MRRLNPRYGSPGHWVLTLRLVGCIVLADSRMEYKVLLIKSDEGFAVGCPALPGCWSQGKNREEALSNIREAIRLWLEVAEEDIRREAAQEHEEVASELVTV
jgi:predicted RNase H-like HicB family nuclease